MSNYYESEDLKKFGDIGQHAKKLADGFFKYYGDVTGSDGALTKRENRRFLIIQSIAIFAGYLYYCFAAPHAARSPDAQPSRLTEWIAAPLRSEAGNAGEQEIAAPDPATQKEWIAISAECADAEDPVACARTAD